MSGNDAAEALEAGSIRYNGKTYAYKSDVLTVVCMGIDKTGEVKASKDLYRGGQLSLIHIYSSCSEMELRSVMTIWNLALH